MDRIARAKANEREELFRVVAAQMELHPVNIEKDFWVCWLLKQLFTIAEFEGWLVFKGGTSLSKCFNLIQRFSEDVDLAVDSRGWVSPTRRTPGGSICPARSGSGC